MTNPTLTPAGAIHHLARALAGLDHNPAPILAAFPEAPTNGGGRLDLTALLAWYSVQPAEVKEAVTRANPEGPAPDSGPELLGWRIYSLTDAYTPRPPVEYVVAGLFPLPSLSIVYGPPGCFKTMLLADLAACVAAGLPWLGPLPLKSGDTGRATIPAPALWLDFDNGVRTMHERIEAVARARDLPEATPLYYVSMPSPWLDASSWENTAELAQRAQALDARLIIIDNLRDVAGGVDENAAEMGDVMSNFRRLSEETGAAVILIHHQRKASGISSRSGDTLRGHSSIEAALDLALLVEREEQAETIQIKASKVRGADVLPFGALFTYEWREGTTDLATVRFYGLDVEDLTSDAAIRRAVLETVGSSPGANKGAIVKEVKGSLPDVGINRIRLQVDRLAIEGQIIPDPGKRTERCYHLPMTKDEPPAQVER